MEVHTPSKSKSTVFVGGISWKADEEGLRKYFEQFGTVIECKIIFDRATNKSKGYGFLTFSTAEEAQRVKETKDLSFLGKTMNVGEAYHKNRTDPAAVSPLLGAMGMPVDMVYNVDYMAGQAGTYPAYYYDQYAAQYQPYMPYAVGVGYYPGVVQQVGGVQYYDPNVYAQVQPMAALPFYSPEQSVLDPSRTTVATMPPMMLPPAQAQVATPSGEQVSHAAHAPDTSAASLPPASPHALASPDIRGTSEETVEAELERSMDNLTVTNTPPRPEGRHLRCSSEGSSARTLQHVGGRTLSPAASRHAEPGAGSNGVEKGPSSLSGGPAA